MSETSTTTDTTLHPEPASALPMARQRSITAYQRPPLVQQALSLLACEVMVSATTLAAPQAVRDYLQLLLADRPHEVFVAVFLDSQHRVIEAVELFRGTLTQTSVYPREVVLEALARHSAAVIFSHNHPSGSTEPSQADITLTQTLHKALSLFDVKVLDHFIVSRTGVLSFAEKGLL